MRWDAQMAAHDLDEERISSRRPDGGQMTDRPEQDADDPEAEAEAERGGQRAVKDGD
jgi:hypothetical protein